MLYIIIFVKSHNGFSVATTLSSNLEMDRRIQLSNYKDFHYGYTRMLDWIAGYRNCISRFVLFGAEITLKLVIFLQRIYIVISYKEVLE